MRQSFVAGLLALVLAPVARAQGLTGEELHGPRQATSPVVRSATGAGLTLAEVLDAAIAHHPLVQAAGARLMAAEGSRRTAAALDNPSLNYQLENTPFPGQSPRPGLDRETSVFLTFPLEGLYQRAPRVRRADQEVEAGRAAVASARRTVALDAARAFYRVAAAQVAARSAEDIRASLERLAAFNRTRVAEGAVAEGELIRVEVELGRAGTSLALERIELGRARAELAAFLGEGRAPGSGFVVSEDPGPSWTVPCPLDDLVVLAKRIRPDLSEARARVAAAGAEEVIQRSLVFRQLGASFGVKRIGDTDAMIAGLGVSVPVFNRNRGESQRATGERVAAEQELVWAERRAREQIQGAYEAARLLTEETGRLEGSLLGRAEESQRIALAAYQEGATSLLQVLDATRTLGDVRLLSYRTAFSQRLSLLELSTAAGVDALDALHGGFPCSTSDPDHGGPR